MKRVLVLLLILVMASSLYITVFAANNTDYPPGYGTTDEGSAAIDIIPKVRVVFDGNGGKNSNLDPIWRVWVTYPGLIPEPNPIPVHDDGLVFKGWTLVRNGNNLFDFNTNIADVIDNLIIGDFDYITLYARWRDHVVTFDANGGSNATNGQRYDYQEVLHKDLAIRPPDPTRSGYRFIGWSVDELNYTPYDFNTPVIEDFTLYAFWERVGRPDPPVRPPGDDVEDPEVPLEPPEFPDEPPEIPDEPTDEPTDVELPETPMADPDGNLPQTGVDDWTLLIFILMIIGTALVATGIVQLRNKKKTTR